MSKPTVTSTMRPPRESGFTLIETMVTIVILALGLLGMLGMIINSLKLSASSNNRAIATKQAYAMAEVLRANPTLIAWDSSVASAADCRTSNTCSFSNIGANNPRFDVAGLDAQAMSYTDCFRTTATAGGCARSRIVVSEFVAWQAAVQTQLPNGLGIICRDSSANDGVAGTWACDNTGAFVVKVCWDDSRVSANTGIGGPQCTRVGV